MSLQQKVFEAGLQLTVDELQALALAEAQLREKARARSGDSGLCITDTDDPGAPEDLSGLLIENLE
jgi:hypothetical protein